MESRLPAGVLHQYAPVDRLPWVRRFLDHWQPGLALWIESEFWPNMLAEISHRRIPLVLVNARISTRSFNGWRRVPATIRSLLGRFDLCLPQTETDRERLVALGARHVGPVGNLKFAAQALPADSPALAALRSAIGDRACWLAASTHPGEDEVIAAVHRRLATRLPRLLTLIVPRHPGRGARIARMLAGGGLSAALRSSGESLGETTSVYVADTVGELGLFYRLAPVAFIGGSLVAHGGQNLLEPAKLGCAVVHGPDMANFAAIAAEMRAAGATETAGDAPAIAAAIGRLLTDDALRAQRVTAATRVAEHKAHILDTVVTALAPFLARLEPAATPGDAAPAAQRHARA
jgi:3-deoxy-D-manno-octulosonic-acid transferase